ncbi:phage tail tape measure protein [Amphibacillus sp. Q70]|uniref:phage tail tape measure protein n=1 Tax=Amphibacillus sp. Q70 TaxID=3453416 RepID=UPI003F87E9D0
MATVGDLKTRISLDSAQFEQSMAGVNRQLKGLKQEQKAVTSSGTGFARGVDELRNKSDVLNRTLELQQAKVAELRRRYEESREATGDNSKETQNANAEYQKAVAEMNKTENALKGITAEIEKQTNPWLNLSKGMDDAGKKMQDIGKGMTDFGKKWSMRVTAPIVGLGVAALNVGMDFQQGMSQVQALTGETGAGMEVLEEQAKDLGATTRFSATEAAEGMAFLGMAGFETNEILESMPGLLDLAASSNMDLGRAADIASNIISGFGYEASEAGRVADVLAAGASSANTNVAQLGDSMATVAPVASALGLDVEGLTAAVGMMSDAGIQGSQAGRMLRQGILRLADPTGAAADLIKDLGINVFDSEGNMKELHDVVGELENGLDGMSSQAQTAALSTLFGSQSVAGWTALIERGSGELKDYTGELLDAEGAASDMAATMQDNARGKIVEFQSALEGIGIALAEHMIPAVTDAVEWGTDLVRKFGELDDETQKQILTMAGLAAAIGPVSLVAGNLTTTIGGAFRGMSKLTEVIGTRATKGTLTGGLTGLVGTGGTLALAGAGIAGMAWAGYELYQHLNTELIPEVDLFSDEVSDSTQQAVQSFMDLNDEATVQLRQLSWAGQEVSEEMSESIVSTFDQMGDQIVEALEEQKEESLEAVQSLFDDASEITQEEQEKIIEGVEEGFDNQIETIEEGNRRIEEILNEASEEKRKITADEEAEINQIREEMQSVAIETLTATEAEQQIILEKMADQAESISKRQASDVIKNSIELRDGVIEEADRTFYDQKLAFEKMRDETGTITADQADMLIEEAERQRDETVEQAEEMHQDVLDKAEEYHPEIYDEVSKHTGEILTNYDLLKTDLAKNGLEIFRDSKSLWESIEAIFTGDQIEFTKPSITGWLELESNARTIWDKIRGVFQQPISMPAPSMREVNRQPKSADIARFNADGTDFHPGGLSWLGEEGDELVRLGDKWSVASFGLYDLERGAQVFTHDESKNIIRALNNMPAYATGVSPSGESDRVINQLDNMTKNRGDIVQHITIVSPDPTSPSENARKIKQASRQLAMGGW